MQAKYKNFFTVWPEARQKIPHALLQELRITPEVPGYDEMISRLFLGVIDGNLETEEQLRAFLEPYSPPAPPPPVTVRRTRGSKKSGEKTKVLVEAAFDGDADDALPLDDDEAVEEPIEDVEDEDEGDSEPPVTLPPAAKKSAPAPKKSPAESQPSSLGSEAPPHCKTGGPHIEGQPSGCEVSTKPCASRGRARQTGQGARDGEAAG